MDYLPVCLELIGVVELIKVVDGVVELRVVGGVCLVLGSVVDDVVVL